MTPRSLKLMSLPINQQIYIYCCYISSEVSATLKNGIESLYEPEATAEHLEETSAPKFPNVDFLRTDDADFSSWFCCCVLPVVFIFKRSIYHSPRWQDKSSSPVLPTPWWCPAGPLRRARGWGGGGGAEKQGESVKEGQREHQEWQRRAAWQKWAPEKCEGKSASEYKKKEKWRWENRKRADNSYQAVNEEPAEL